MAARCSVVKAKRKVSTQQNCLETAIIKYQEAVHRNDTSDIDSAYNEILEIYPALSYVTTWMKRYIFLYDSVDDFQQDYLKIFCTSLVNWKPRHLRRESKYNGSGDFKNYFWSSLQNTYINMVKSENSGKRSISSKCPWCDKWCSSLSTHLLQHHSEKLWELLFETGMDIQNSERCPFCQNYKLSAHLDRGVATAKLKRHIVSMHSNYLFDCFKERYPGCIVGPGKPMSVNVGEHDDEEEFSIYDLTYSMSGIDDLLDADLSDVQKEIINRVFNHRNKNFCVAYNSKLYNCSRDKFDRELADLRQKMFLYGMDNGGD